MKGRTAEQIEGEVRGELGEEFTGPVLASYMGLNRAAVVRAIQERRLRARRVGRLWVVRAEDAGAFIAARIAARARQLREAECRGRRARS